MEFKEHGMGQGKLVAPPGGDQKKQSPSIPPHPSPSPSPSPISPIHPTIIIITFNLTDGV